MKNSFVFYTEYLDQIEILSDAQAGVLLKAIMLYANGEDLPEMDGMTMMAFSFIKAQMDRDAEKYDAICEKRREAGNRGGRPQKAKKANGFSEKQKKQMVFSKTKQKQKNPDNDNEDEYVDEYEDEYVDENVDVDENENENDDDIKISTFSDEKVCPADAERVVDAWNATGVNPIKKLSPNTKRYEQLYARIREYGVDEILAAVAEIKQSEFLRGSSGKFLITFDWFIKPNNFIKVLEGNYRDRASPDVFDEWRDA